MTIDNLSTEDKKKIQELINQGVQVLEDTKVMKESLKESIDAIAEELDIKKNTLNKAIKMAHKINQKRTALQDEQEDLDGVDQLLRIAGKN